MYTIHLSRTELARLNQRRKQAKTKAISDRLHCIYLAHSGKGNQAITELLAVNKNSVTDWIKLYLDQGLDALCRPIDYDRRSSKLDAYIEAIKNDVQDHTISTLAELQDWIKTEYSIELEQSWLWRCCKKNSIYLTKKLV